MSDRAPAFQFYPTDFLSDPNVMVMTTEEIGAYWLLICACWLDCELPNDRKFLARLAKLTDEKFDAAWPAIEKCFRANSTGLRHKRLDRERSKQRDHRKVMQKNGIAGAAARWQGHSQAIPENAIAIIKNSSSSSSSSPTSVKKKRPSVSLPKEPADPRIKEFLEWFQVEYRDRRHGAAYLVHWPKDTAIVKALLKAVGLPELQDCSRILLSDKTDDPFIVETDRGVGILATKFNWLESKRAAWVARQQRGVGVA